MQVVLSGLHVSVYTRIVRMALEQKNVSYRLVNANPFVAIQNKDPGKVSPFNRIPVLRHGDFELYETGAILHYVDGAFPGPTLVPKAPVELSRMAQVMGIVDSYAYWPMVRQVFTQRVMNPILGKPVDQAETEAGLNAAEPVLAALEDIAREGLQLNKWAVTLADVTLAPMIDYFRMAEEGQKSLERHPNLVDWWEWVQQLNCFQVTQPKL